jgi:antitoxin VapB
MALNIKDKETEELATEIASQTGESKTGAVRQALRERRDRLALERGTRGPARTEGEREKRRKDFRRFLETEIWPMIPEEERGKPPMTKAEKEEILGYGPGGV